LYPEHYADDEIDEDDKGKRVNIIMLSNCCREKKNICLKNKNLLSQISDMSEYNSQKQ
jgi:hypothetical protein